MQHLHQRTNSVAIVRKPLASEPEWSHQRHNSIKAFRDPSALLINTLPSSAPSWLWLHWPGWVVWDEVLALLKLQDELGVGAQCAVNIHLGHQPLGVLQGQGHSSQCSNSVPPADGTAAPVHQPRQSSAHTLKGCLQAKPPTDAAPQGQSQTLPAQQAKHGWIMVCQVLCKRNNPRKGSCLLDCIPYGLGDGVCVKLVCSCAAPVVPVQSRQCQGLGGTTPQTCPL